MVHTRASPWATTRRPTIRELLFLDQLSPVVVGAVVIAVLGTAVAIGRIALLAHIHFATERDAGEDLNPIASFLGTGSGFLTALPGWLATLFFIFAILRLGSGPLEPPPGGPAERQSVSQLRSGLRSEFRIVRIAFAGLAVVATVDASRALQYVVAALRGNLVAQGSWIPTTVEAAGLATAALTLGLWAWQFRSHLEQIGAV